MEGITVEEGLEMDFRKIVMKGNIPAEECLLTF